MKITNATRRSLNIPFYCKRVERAMHRAQTHDERVYIDGHILVSDAPGLGIEVDEKAVEKYTVDPDTPTPKRLYRRKKRILRISWPGVAKQKRVWEFTDEAIYQKTFYAGSIPGFERGVTLEVIEDDDSATFKKAHAALAKREAAIPALT